MMRKILIDCRFAALHAGLGRYTRELVTHLVKGHTLMHYVLLVRNKNESWLQQIVSLPHVEMNAADIPHYSLQEQVTLPTLIRHVHPDLFFTPHFNIPFFCPVPFVVTIHDLILHRYPNAASLQKQLVYRVLMKRAVARAAGIIAVSEFTKSELRETYGSSIVSKMHVIREGVDASYRPADQDSQKKVREHFSLYTPYFLYVGNTKQHKNVEMLLEAYKQSGVHDTELVLVTGIADAKRLSLPKGARVLSDVPDEMLPALYSAARCFITPSLYEGFGLPVAEALACGCPVVAVNRSAIPEVAQGHARLIEPRIEAFVEALRSPPERSEAFIVGTWDDTAKATADVLQRLT